MVTEDPAIDADAVIDRMRQVTGAATDVALGALFRMGTSGVSTWRRRHTVPYAECVTLALRHGVSLDWLLLGIEPMQPRPGESVSGDSAPPAGTAEDPRISRMARFLRAWQAGHDADDIAWLERTLARSVPEYAEWLAANTRPVEDGNRS